MLDRLRQEAVACLAGIEAGVFATMGPAGVQASWVACRASGLRLYLLLPAAADHLVNIEGASEVALAGNGWRLTGVSTCLAEETGPWTLTYQPWQVVVEVTPDTLHLDGEFGQPNQTLDFAPLHP